MEEVIRFDNVALVFDGREVLRDITFSVSKGETCVFWGTTGTGKTQLLKLALGLIKPDAGRISVFGADITNMEEKDLFPLRERVGMVFQEMALFDSLPVRENVAYRVLEEMRQGEANVGEDELDRRVRECLHFVGLEDAIDKMPAELSGGMQRRVGIARALITQPQLMLYDSPTAGLDPVTSQYILEYVIKLRDSRGVSALFVTHRLQDAFILASWNFDRAGDQVGRPMYGSVRPAEEGPGGAGRTRIFLLRDGGIYFEGTAGELLATEDDYVRQYLN